MFKLYDLIISNKSDELIRASEFDLRYKDNYRLASYKEIVMYFKRDLDAVLNKYNARLYSEDESGTQHTVCAFSKGVFATDLQEPSYHW